MGEDFDKGRREFLKQSVLSVGKTVYEYYQQQKEAPAETGPKESPVKVRTDWLRPPGAVDEELFLDRCTRCGDCLPACPRVIYVRIFPVSRPARPRPCSRWETARKCAWGWRWSAGRIARPTRDAGSAWRNARSKRFRLI